MNDKLKSLPFILFVVAIFLIVGGCVTPAKKGVSAKKAEIGDKEVAEEAVKIKRVISNFGEGWNRLDLEKIRTCFTESASIVTGGKNATIVNLERYLKEVPERRQIVGMLSLGDYDVKLLDSTLAKAEVPIIIKGGTIAYHKYDLIKKGGAWKIKKVRYGRIVKR